MATELNISDDFRIALNKAEAQNKEIKFTTKNICLGIKTYVKRMQALLGDDVAFELVNSLDAFVTDYLLMMYSTVSNQYDEEIKGSSEETQEIDEESDESDI